jgi:hypothetical protein
MSYRLVDEVIKRCAGTAVPPSERLLAVVLGHCTNAKTGDCYPSVKTLCRLTGYRRSAVLQLLHDLKQRSAVATIRRGPHSSSYVLHPTALVDERGPNFGPLGEQKRSTPATKRSTGADKEVQILDPEQGRNREGTGKPCADAPAAHRRAAARTRSLKAPPNPRIKSLVDAFCRQHRDVLHQPYRVVRGRDGKHLQDALRLYEDVAPLLTAMQAYFGDERELCAFPASIPHFVSRIAFLLHRQGPAAHPAVADAVVDRTAGLILPDLPPAELAALKQRLNRGAG